MSQPHSGPLSVATSSWVFGVGFVTKPYNLPGPCAGARVIATRHCHASLLCHCGTSLPWNGRIGVVRVPCALSLPQNPGIMISCVPWQQNAPRNTGAGLSHHSVRRIPVTESRIGLFTIPCAESLSRSRQTGDSCIPWQPPFIRNHWNRNVLGGGGMHPRMKVLVTESRNHGFPHSVAAKRATECRNRRLHHSMAGTTLTASSRRAVPAASRPRGNRRPHPAMQAAGRVGTHTRHAPPRWPACRP